MLSEGEMNFAPQKRQSCEACRKRKLKCSGEEGGCSRCHKYSLDCKFKDKRAPGRPRKRVRQEPEPPRSQGSQHGASETSELPTPGPSTSGPSQPTSLPSAGSSDAANILNEGEDEAWPFPINLSEITGLGSCSPNWANPNVSGAAIAPLACQMSSDFLPSAELWAQACTCATEVTESIRAVRRATPAHSMICALRAGIDLAEKLLSCTGCYDLSKPPRITFQNVFLTSRLMLEVVSGYERYVQWLRSSYNEYGDNDRNETVYLAPGNDISSVPCFGVSGQAFLTLVMHGLQTDAKRLTALCKSFALRQQARHRIGHEACPDTEGRCWSENFGVDLDPSDICPHNYVASSLTPCYRIVEDVRILVGKFSENVRQGDTTPRIQ